MPKGAGTLHTNRRRNPGERGFILLLYTLMMLFIIIPMVGLAIDAGILYTVKAKLQAATDGASLGAARSLNRGQDLTSQQAAATDTAIRYYHANFPNNWMGVTPINDPTVTWPTSPNPATAIINVQGDITSPTWFMRVLGFNSVHLTAIGQATRRDVNVLLVIDRSGSLQASGSCPTLSSSAALFVDSFSNNRDRMGMVTFGTYYYVDFPFNYNFQSPLATMLGSLQCVGWTNAGAAYWKGYQALKALGDLNALNVILFFTDGQPNTVTFGTDDGGSGPLLPKQSSGGCKTPYTGFSGTVGGSADGVYQQTVATYPAPNPDQFLIGTSDGNTGGCTFGSGIDRGISSDVPYLPSTDVWGNSISASTLGGAGFPATVTKSGNNIQVTSNNVTNGGINALDNAAQRARQDASGANMPFVVYTIGLGNSGGVNDELLKRIANDPGALAYQSAYSTGTYIYTPDTAHLAAAFASIADDIMRLSK